MAITITDDLGLQSKTTGSTLAFNATSTGAGDTIVVAALCFANATAPTCSDNAGNTYTLIKTLPFNAGTNSLCVFYCPNANATTGGVTLFTVNFGVSSSVRVANLWNIAGLGASATADVSPSTTGSTSTPSLASGTLANAAEAVFAFLGINRAAGGTFTIDTANGWGSTGSNVGSSGGSAATNLNMCSEWQVVAATTSRTAAPTITAAPWGDIVVSFKAGVAAVQQKVTNISQAVKRASYW